MSEINKYKLILVIGFNLVLLFSCKSDFTKEYRTIEHESPVGVAQAGDANDLFTNKQKGAEERLEEIKERYTYLCDQKISDIGLLVQAEWNNEGDEVNIYFLNDIAEYEGGGIITLKLEDEIYKRFCRGNQDTEVVEKFIASINEEMTECYVLKTFEIKDLRCILTFSSCKEVVFTGYYDEFAK